jgi:succinyl-CoA synthetase alpha subunit
VDGVPVYNSVLEAAARHRIDVSLIFVPGAYASEAVLEAAQARVPWIVCITEGIPQLDMLAVLPVLRETGARLIGPNTPGIIRPGAFMAGIMPVDPFRAGEVAVFSRSGTLTYEASSRLSAAGIGQALAVGLGGDPFIGLGFEDWLEIVRDDARVKAALLLGEIGGRAEEDAAAFVRAVNFPKPVAAFVAGLTSPPGRRMGHAGAILEEGGGAGRKLTALEEAGIAVCPDLDGIAAVMAWLTGTT